MPSDKEALAGEFAKRLETLAESIEQWLRAVEDVQLARAFDAKDRRIAELEQELENASYEARERDWD